MSQCLFGDRCRTYWSTGSLGIADSRGLCVPCSLHGRESIRQLFPDWLMLDSQVGKVTYGSGSDVALVRVQAPEAPIPLKTEVDYLARWIAWSLTEWEDVVRERGRLAPIPAPVRAIVGVPRASRTLVEHYSILLSTPVVRIVDYTSNEAVYADGIDAIGLFIELHRRARNMLGLSRTREHRAVPCPKPPLGCGLFELASYLDGKLGVGDDVFCMNCGWRCTAEQYSQYVKTFLPPEDHYAEAA